MIIKRPEFEKTAGYKMGKDSTSWKEDIVKNFIDSIGDKFSDNLQFDLEMGNLDDNTGYGVGSVIAWSGPRKINFPIVIKDYEMAPVDVFVSRLNGETVYYHATEQNITKALSGEELFNGYKKDNNNTTLIKRPGGVPIAEPVVIDQKGTGLRSLPGQFGKYASDTSILRNFERNSGTAFTDAMAKFAEQNYTFKADFDGVVEAKKAVALFESQVMDPDNLDLLIAPCVCELRIKTPLSIEDFEAENANGVDLAKRIGRPVQGMMFKGNDYSYVFVSPDGSWRNVDHDKAYGIMYDNALIPGMLNLIREKLEKSHPEELGGCIGNRRMYSYDDETVAIVIFDGKADKFTGSRRFIYNGKTAIIGDNRIMIPAKVKEIVAIKEITDGILAEMSKGKQTYLYPEDAIVAFVKDHTKLSYGSIITPDTDLLDEVKKIKTSIGLTDTGFYIRGIPSEQIAAIIPGGLEHLNVASLKKALKLLGADTQTIKTACEELRKGECVVYGLKSPSFEKVATRVREFEVGERVREITANFVRRDLTKEASELNDPKSVEKVLSLNMVTKDNVVELIEDIDSYKEILSKIANLLILSRVGVSTIDETALKRVMENLTEVINGIERVKVSLGV